jgi:hypothetical protein
MCCKPSGGRVVENRQDDTLENLVVARLKRYGQATATDLEGQFQGKDSREVTSALRSLESRALIRRSPRGSYYVPGHITPAMIVQPQVVRARSALVEFGADMPKGGAFSFNGRVVMPGDALTNRELVDGFRVGNSRGIRVSKATGTILLVSSVHNDLYEDRWQDGVYKYTGEGRLGDQPMTGGNLAVADSPLSGASLLLFFKRKTNAYEFQGEVRLDAAPFAEQQPDETGLIRRVWVFPLAAV